MNAPFFRKHPRPLAHSPTLAPSLGRHRGATMLSVMLMSLSMMTVGTLVMRSAARETSTAMAGVAREKAMMAAHASVELAAANYRRKMFHPSSPNEGILSEALKGSNPATGGDARYCSRYAKGKIWDSDCIPGMGSSNPVTGQRNHLIGNKSSDCSGRPCMRPGAVAMLPLSKQSVNVPWSRVPMADLVEGGDPEALVTVWVRNNSSEALGASGTGSWVVDKDNRVVITGMARVRNTTVAIEQEYYFRPSNGAKPLVPPSPDEGYGGGHNGDNSVVAVCEDNYAVAKIGDGR